MSDWTLPLDVTRCKPVQPDSNCRNCKRWAEMPEQTWGENTTVIVCANSKDIACVHMALSELGVKQ